MKKKLTRLFSVLLAAVLVFGTLPVSALGTDVADPPASAVDESSAAPEESAVDDAAQPEEQSAEEEAVAVQASTGDANEYSMNIFFLDCGRKYYSVDSIKQFIDNASAAGFNYIQLAVGNDGLRFLLNDMELTVNCTTYSSEEVSSAIHTGNETYHNFDVDELTESEMDTIIAYANSKGMGVIPCINTPGHMDAILSAATSLTGTDCSYNGSARTINVTNTTAVAFTQALLQKYITYFAGKGCQYFNMGADEYANDIYTSGTMGFGNLQSTGEYSYYVTYVNKVAALLKGAGMTPMAFNDGIYFRNVTSSGTFDTDIVICYWSAGWGTYIPMPASTLASMGFKLVNTHGDYYWVLGKSDVQCSASKASGFNYKSFQGSTIDDPVGSMFCVWADYPGSMTEDEVLKETAATIAAFGKTLPQFEVDDGSIKISIGNSTETATAGNLTVGGMMVLHANETVTWTTSNEGVATIASADETGVNAISNDSTVSASAITVTAVGAGSATITATDGEQTAELALEVTAAEDTEKKTEYIIVEVGKTKTATVQADGDCTGYDEELSDEYVTVKTETDTTDPTTYYEAASFEAGKEFYISAEDTAAEVADDNAVKVTFEAADNGQYYIKLADGSYIYPNASRRYLNYWDYSLGKTKTSVTIAMSNDSKSVDVSRKYTDTGSFGTSYSTNAYLTLSGTTFDAGNSSSSHTLYLYTQKTTPGTTTTKVSFTGKKATEEGPTEITVGNVTYYVTVTEEDLSTVDPLKIEYWITNNSLYSKNTSSEQVTMKDTASTINYLAINASDPGVYSEEGVEVTSLVDATATDDTNRGRKFWQTRILDTSVKDSTKDEAQYQTTSASVDKTKSGLAFTKVRYQGGWQVYTENKEWVDVDRTQTTVNFKWFNDKNVWQSNTVTREKNQLIAYYMEVLDISKKKSDGTTVTEMDVGGSDWGTRGDTADSTTLTQYNSEGACSISFQIVYESGMTNPASNDASNLITKTYFYNYWNVRGVGTLNLDGQGCEIYKVTATTGTLGYDKPVYNKTLEDITLSWKDDETVVWGSDDTDASQKSVTIGNDTVNPSVETDAQKNLSWSKSGYGNGKSNNAILIKIYVKSVAENNLTVHYFMNNTDPQNEFHHYQIGVDNTETFDHDFGPDSTSPTGLQHNTVTNYVDEVETVTSVLKDMPSIPAQYRYTEYKLIAAYASDDGHDAYLIYTFNNTASFVVDFGTSLKLEPKDINDGLTGDGVEIVGVEVNGVSYGKVETDDNYNIIYTPGSSFPSSKDGENLTVTYTGTLQLDENKELQKGTVTYVVSILPASNVLYEEGFLSKTEGDETWKNVTKAANAAQQTQKVDNGTYEVFGYDDSYKNFTDANGVWSITGLEKNKYSAPLTTEFYGNTFDLIGDCGPTTGGVLMTVIKDGANGKHATIANIDTRYDDGTNNTTIHQVPLAHIVMANEKYGYDDALCTVKVYATGLEKIDGTSAVAVQAAPAMDADTEFDALLAQILEENDLTMDDVDFVTISAADTLDVAATPDAVDFYSATYASDGTGSSGYPAGTHVEIDGFRVYRSANKTDAVAANYPEKEQNVTYQNIWDVAEESFVGFTDKKGEVTGTVQEYIADGGPQNEIYLKKGDEKSHAVVFQIGNMKSTIQVSLRAVKGTGSVKVNLGNEVTKEITSVTEMYYEVTSDENGVFTIANTGDGILAIGNVKLPSYVTEITSAQELGDDMVSKVLTAALYGNSEPDPATFVPETFETKVSSSTVIRNKVVTLKVTVSSDVAYITVNGKKYTRTGLKGFGGKNRTIRVVSVMPKDETPNFEIVAYNANGEKSETKTVSE